MIRAQIVILAGLVNPEAHLLTSVELMARNLSRVRLMMIARTKDVMVNVRSMELGKIILTEIMMGMSQTMVTWESTTFVSMISMDMAFTARKYLSLNMKVVLTTRITTGYALSENECVQMFARDESCE